MGQVDFNVDLLSGLAVTRSTTKKVIVARPFKGDVV
jgi:hypothetical protein